VEAFSPLNSGGATPMTVKGHARQLDDYSKYGPVAVESTAPKPMTDHDDRRCGRSALLWRERPPKDRRYSQDVEVIAGHGLAIHHGR
jgi:hypothetical protein